jgi:hypothetical protein
MDMSITASSFRAARVSFAAGAAFVVLFAVLHVIKPELDPSWRMGSEYAIGDYGWVMRIAMFALALSCAALFSALRPEIETTGGRIALGLLLVDAAALVVGGTFVVDPITTKPADMTTHGMIHSAAGAIFLFGFPIAGVLLSRSLERRQIWRSAVQSIRWTAHFMWISVAMTLVHIITVQSSGRVFGPGSWNGWLNRLTVLSFCAWLMTLSWRAIQMRKPALDASVRI